MWSGLLDLYYHIGGDDWIGCNLDILDISIRYSITEVLVFLSFHVEMYTIFILI